jgi:hypothetical protein
MQRKSIGKLSHAELLIPPTNIIFIYRIITISGLISFVVVPGLAITL